MEPILLKPFYVSPVWAGTHLAQIRGLDASAKDNHGEAFDVSAHPTTCGVILNGPWVGMSLADAIATHKAELLGDVPEDAVVQVTWMDPVQNLSIQVHPTDEYARKADGDFGKTESWYIAEAAPGATLIGGCTTDDHDALREAAADDTIGDKYCKRVSVKAGDFVFVPAGTMHALGPGCFAVEIGSFGNQTYRMCDWGRGRELHVEKAFDVVDTSLEPTVRHLGAWSADAPAQEQLGAECAQFKATVVDVSPSWSADTNGRYQVVTCVGGTAKVSTADGEVVLGYTDSCLIPACCASYTVTGPCRIIQAVRP